MRTWVFISVCISPSTVTRVLHLTKGTIVQCCSQLCCIVESAVYGRRWACAGAPCSTLGRRRRGLAHCSAPSCASTIVQRRRGTQVPVRAQRANLSELPFPLLHFSCAPPRYLKKVLDRIFPKYRLYFSAPANLYL